MEAVLLFIQKSGAAGSAIIVLSIVALVLAVDRFIAFRREFRRDPEFMHNVASQLESGNFTGAVKLLQEADSPISRALSPVVQKGLDHHCCRERGELEKIISYSGEEEMRRLSKGLNLMALIGNVTPMLGLLGTVLGMIKAFMVIENLGGKVNASVLAGGIWEALLTTAEGLTVAIPIIMIHSYFTNRLDTMAVEIEKEGMRILGIMQKQEMC